MTPFVVFMVKIDQFEDRDNVKCEYKKKKGDSKIMKGKLIMADL